MLLKSVTVLTSAASRAVPWLRQTSTITGISTLVGVGVAVATGEMTWQVALPVATGAVVAMLLPGHPEAGGVITQVAIDAIKVADPRTRVAGMRIPMKPPGYTDLKPPGVPISNRPPFQSQIARDGVVS